MVLDSLEKLFIYELKDLYGAETQQLEALPKMADSAADSSLQAAFLKHLEQTRVQVQRLEQIFSNLNVSPEGSLCAGMGGLLSEGVELLKSEGE